MPNENDPNSIEENKAIPYDPNQIISLESNFTGSNFLGEGSTFQSKIETCQETFRILGEAALNSQLEKSDNIDSQGIHSVKRNLTASGRSYESAQIEVEPGISAADPKETGEAGLPTGAEEQVVEAIEKGIQQALDVLKDLDLTVTIQKTDDETKIRVFSGAGEPTSDEKPVNFEILPSSEVSVNASNVQKHGENITRVVKETGGDPLTLLTVSDSGQPTQGEGTNTAQLITSGKNDLDQRGLINNAINLQVTVTIGSVLNVQLINA